MKIHLKYKGISVNALGLPTSSSMKDRATRFGHSKRKYSEYKHFSFNFPLTAPKDQIIICDIPSANRSERDWLRYQLRKFEYSMLEKNVWVGASPLPSDFLKYIKSINLMNKLYIFKLAKPYSRSDKHF